MLTDFVQTKSMGNKSLQAMDLTSIKAVLAEMRKKVIPSRFEKAQQPSSNTIQIGFRTIKTLIWIELSWDAYSARLVEVEKPTKVFGESTLAKQINHSLRQMALIELKQEGFDRVIEFCFAFRPNQSIQRSIVLELMGRHSNILMLNEERKTITLGRQVKNHQSRLRPISTGDFYMPPPSLNGIQPNKKESLESWKERLSLIPISFQKALVQNYQGVSPSLAIQLGGEGKKLAGNFANICVKELSLDNWEYLHKKWLAWLSILEKEEFFINFDGPTDYRVWKEDKSSGRCTGKIGLSLGNYYNNYLEIKRVDELYSSIVKKLSKLKEAEEKNLKKQQKLLVDIEMNKAIKEKADQILCSKNLSKEQIKEAQSLYHKAKKMRRSYYILKERVNHHMEKINSINQSELFLNGLIDNTCESNAELIKSINELKEDLNKFLFFPKRTVHEKS